MKNLIIIAITILALGCATAKPKGPIGTSQNPMKVQFTWQQNLINVGTTLLGAAVMGAAYYEATKRMGDDLQDTLRRERQAISMPVITIPFP